MVASQKKTISIQDVDKNRVLDNFTDFIVKNDIDLKELLEAKGLTALYEVSNPQTRVLTFNQLVNEAKYKLKPPQVRNSYLLITANNYLCPNL